MVTRHSPAVGAAYARAAAARGILPGAIFRQIMVAD